MILVVIIISLNKQTQKEIIIGLITFFFYYNIIIRWSIIHNSSLISNEITNIEQITDKCINNLINDTETFIVDQEAAIDKILCAYSLEYTL